MTPPAGHVIREALKQTAELGGISARWPSNHAKFLIGTEHSVPFDQKTKGSILSVLFED
jgi:hypothetical protein